MRIALPLLLTVVQGTAAMKITPMSASSKAGVALLDKSTRYLGEGEGEGNNDNQNNAYENYDFSWINNFDIKFLGCHHVAHWNSNAEDAEDVRMKVERHVRYRLCPSNTCSSNKALGCTAGYGDYIVDMDTFLQQYLANKQEIQEQKCETALNSCYCGNADDEEKCEYQCFVSAGMTECIENNPYYDDGAKEEIDVLDYTYCAKVGEGGGGGDKNEGEGEEGHEDRLRRQLNYYEAEYFLGPYCSSKGDEIKFGLFTDDTCTEFADSMGGSTTYYSNFGSTLPYYGKSLVDHDCYSCSQYDYDNYETTTLDLCTETYVAAGKCESKLAGYTSYPNENACTYMQGIKISKKSAHGVIYRQYRGTKWAAVTIGIFATTFVLLLFYVLYLKNRVKIAMLMAAASRSGGRKGFWKTLVKPLSPKNIKQKFSRNKNKNDALI